MKKLFLALFVLLPAILVHAGSPPPPPLPPPQTYTVSLGFAINQPAYSVDLPYYNYTYIVGKVLQGGTAYSSITSVTYTPTTGSSVVVETTGANGTFTIAPVSIGSTTITIKCNIPTSYNGGYTYVADTYIYNVTVTPVTSSQALTINVDQPVNIATPTAITSYTITNAGTADPNWTITPIASPLGVTVFTHMLETAILRVFDGRGDEYDYTITSTLWTPGAGQVVLANVSTSQPEYQTLISQRATAVAYAATLGYWPSLVRKIPAEPSGTGTAYAVGSGIANFSYNSSDNVTVLEGTYSNSISLGNGSGDSIIPTSSGSTGVDYDARYGTVYGSPADAALPYSASMAITGSGGSLQFYNNANGVLWFNRVPGTNLTVIGIQGYDDYANADWMGYEIAYLQQGSLPSEAPPQGAITASKAQVLTKGSVIISWTLN